MKKIKSLLAVLLCASLALAVCACIPHLRPDTGDGSDKEESLTAETPSEQTRKAAWYLSSAVGSEVPAGASQFQSDYLSKVVANIKANRSKVPAGYSAVIVINGTITPGTAVHHSLLSITSSTNNDYPPLVLRGKSAKEPGVLDAQSRMRLLYLSGVDLTLADNLSLRNGNIIVQGQNPGGAVLLFGATLKMTGGKIENSRATLGGAVATSKDSNVGGNGTMPRSQNIFSMSGGEISGNSVGTNGMGGAVFISSTSGNEPPDTMLFTGGLIDGNTADSANNGTGGGVYIGGELSMGGGTISNNEALKGGGLYIEPKVGQAAMTNGTITANHANEKGGGVYVGGFGATFTHAGGTISGNTADKGSNDIYPNP
jgi:hypothetical protein